MNSIYPIFTDEKLEKGYLFLKEHNMEDIFDCFHIPNEWKIKKQIPCLDVFCIKGGYLEIDGHVETTSCSKNYTHDLTSLAGCGSCYEASCYMYQLITYIQKREDENFENKAFWTKTIFGV